MKSITSTTDSAGASAELTPPSPGVTGPAAASPGLTTERLSAESTGTASDTQIRPTPSATPTTPSPEPPGPRYQPLVIVLVAVGAGIVADRQLGLPLSAC
jgi:hypothetical protein